MLELQMSTPMAHSAKTVHIYISFTLCGKYKYAKVLLDFLDTEHIHHDSRYCMAKFVH